jgi:hypothetical protein
MYKILSAFRTAEGNTIRYTGSWGVTRVLIFHYAGFVETEFGTMGAWYWLSTTQYCIKVKGVMGDKYGWTGIL